MCWMLSWRLGTWLLRNVNKPSPNVNNCLNASANFCDNSTLFGTQKGSCDRERETTTMMTMERVYRDTRAHLRTARCKEPDMGQTHRENATKILRIQSVEKLRVANGEEAQQQPVELEQEMADDQKNAQPMDTFRASAPKRMELAKKLESKGKLYVRHHQQLKNALCGQKKSGKNGPTENFVLFCNKPNSTPDTLKQFFLALHYLFKLAEAQKNCLFVDLELFLDGHKKTQMPKVISNSLDVFPLIGARLIRICGDQLVTDDLVAKVTQMLGVCTARASDPEKIPSPAADQLLWPCHLPCPCAEKFGGKCPNGDHFWGCDQCGQTFKFAKQKNDDMEQKAPINHLFCDCGGTRVDHLTFRCAFFADHGDQFYAFPSDKLLNIELERQNKNDMVNLLLLGRTGNGKATLINAMHFYAQFDTFEDALQLALHYLFKLAEARKNCLFVDLELFSDGHKKTQMPKVISNSLDVFPLGSRLIRMCGDQLVTDNWVAKKTQTLGVCIARTSDHEKISSPAADQLLWPCHLPCPRAQKFGGKCPNGDHFWGCDQCGQTFKFAKQKNDDMGQKAPITHLLCDCGGTRVDHLTFRCAFFADHGEQFHAFTSLDLLNKELEWQSKEDIVKNLLLLGKTGNGKSTLINAMHFYAQFDTFEDALQLVQDTAGNGDTRGTEMDNQNMANTFGFLRDIGALHGVGIVLKENDNRADASFNYCINGLLSNPYWE
ncbi:hypothetical protein niasHT_030570 [Heterodera trifolii]|uniref:G domain-containing protein n=1 Tax=Heterodera trifolii TaxID=157864 RepID=A0ABD2IYH5_9BILA